jgi:hypothetical protein
MLHQDVFSTTRLHFEKFKSIKLLSYCNTLRTNRQVELLKMLSTNNYCALSDLHASTNIRPFSGISFLSENTIGMYVFKRDYWRSSNIDRGLWDWRSSNIDRGMWHKFQKHCNSASVTSLKCCKHLISLQRNEHQESSWEIERGRCLRLTTSPLYVCRLSRQCGSLDVIILWAFTVCYKDRN